MSQEIQSQVWKLRDLPHSAKLVLLKIGDNANEVTGIAWPSVGYLAEHCCMSERTVQRAISDFIKSGVLVLVGDGERRTRAYTVDLDRARELHNFIKRRRWTVNDTVSPPTAAKPDGDTVSGSKGGDNGGDTMSPSEGDTTSAGGDTVAGEGDTASPKPLTKPYEKKDAPAGARDQGAAPTDAFELRDHRAGDQAGDQAVNHTVDACTVWKEKYHELCADFGVDVWDQWLKLCIPESDVDGVLTLAVPTVFFRDHIETTYKEGLQKTLGRTVVIVQRGWAADANTARRHREQVAAKDAAIKAMVARTAAGNAGTNPTK